VSSRLRTLVRVAELQEAAARSRAAKALTATADAQRALADSRAVLQAGGLVGGSRAALTDSAQLQLVRAEAVTAATSHVADAEQAQRQAVLGWTETQRRHRLFTELHERYREAERARQEKLDQQLADELAGSRRRTPERGR
jgi:flagellar biosynthesis chaperone FliJ